MLLLLEQDILEFRAINKALSRIFPTPRDFSSGHGCISCGKITRPRKDGNFCDGDLHCVVNQLVQEQSLNCLIRGAEVKVDTKNY